MLGTLILAGSDSPNPGTTPGASLHRELELLVEAGLTPTEALKAATAYPANAFGLVGSELVDFYYRYSPPIADYVRERETLRSIIRSLLAVVVYSIEYPVVALLTLFLFGTLAMRRLKGRKSASTKIDRA